ncbi:hypothetical protein [Streptomyces iconiensis]|uniref:Uncharacterized protein n=1 Tax=Streptomyces iconiensis TaxID=1384038 RepID=A0ABT7A3W9_9ACTN|nr:hypothetical protein [Streptomyces iconiensis]MDJ1136038.1 hypothetical protein [Streptomyces iconiensis]
MRRVVVEDRFREAAYGRRSTGLLLLAAAGLLMAYAAWQLFTPYTTEGGAPCSAPVVDLGSRDADDDDHAYGPPGDGVPGPCVTSGRQWPAPVAGLLLALPFTAVGTAKFISGSVALSLREHEDAVRQSEQ